MTSPKTVEVELDPTGDRVLGRAWIGSGAGLVTGPLPHHRTCGFPHTAVEPNGITSP